MTATPPPFDREKAKREWLQMLKILLGLAVLGAALYYPIMRITDPPDTPLQMAVKANDVEAVRLHLGPPDHPDASDIAHSVYRLALETLSPSNPATTEVLALVLTRTPRERPLIGTPSTTRPADEVFTRPSTRGSSRSEISAVELAARQWSPDGVRVLLDSGLTIGSRSVSGALVKAASNGAAPIITLLLDAGADVNGRDRHNDTALAMARRVGNAEIVALLLARGARE